MPAIFTDTSDVPEILEAKIRRLEFYFEAQKFDIFQLSAYQHAIKEMLICLETHEIHKSKGFGPDEYIIRSEIEGVSQKIRICFLDNDKRNTIFYFNDRKVSDKKIVCNLSRKPFKDPVRAFKLILKQLQIKIAQRILDMSDNDRFHEDNLDPEIVQFMDNLQRRIVFDILNDKALNDRLPWIGFKTPYLSSTAATLDDTISIKLTGHGGDNVAYETLNEGVRDTLLGHMPPMAMISAYDEHEMFLNPYILSSEKIKIIIDHFDDPINALRIQSDFPQIKETAIDADLLLKKLINQM